MAKNLFRHLNLYYWLRKLSFSKLFQNFRFFNDSFKRKIIFYYIFKSLHWRDYNKTQSEESVSGLGSDVRITEKLVLELSGFIKDNQIKSLLDVACGDFIWMKNIVNENKSLRYCGLEIVNDIVENNNKILVDDLFITLITSFNGVFFLTRILLILFIIVYISGLN